jgi:N-acyl-phosphatidylethanolamine-hydrolysing phospholipase D
MPPTAFRLLSRATYYRNPTPKITRNMSSVSASSLLYAVTVSAPSLTSTEPDTETAEIKAWHSKRGGFKNPWPSFSALSGPRIGIEYWGRKLLGKANRPDTAPPNVMVHTPEFNSSRTANDRLRATWLGHACYYVEFPHGLRVLFDPVVEDRCGPYGFGPKRFTQPPCQIEDLPHVDIVVISHNHYDHMSYPTVSAIAKHHPNAHFFVPLGNKKWFLRCGITQCTELDWWQQVDLTFKAAVDGDVREKTKDATSASHYDIIHAQIGCTPAQHMTNRSFYDQMATLWASWTITSGGKSIWFAGDTGYRTIPKAAVGEEWTEKWAHLPRCPAFKEIGNLRGPFDLGLIPVGAYEPRYIMSPMHASPRDAVEIFKDTKCKNALGMHWGTWVLTEEDVLAPREDLKTALRECDLPETGVFDTIDIGQSREY